MLAIAGAPSLLLGARTHQPGAAVGGIAFLMIPQITGWMLFVGLRTGRIPTRGSSEIRAESPLAFWMVAATYIAILLAYLGMLALVGADIAMAPAR